MALAPEFNLFHQRKPVVFNVRASVKKGLDTMSELAAGAADSGQLAPRIFSRKRARGRSTFSVSLRNCFFFFRFFWPKNTRPTTLSCLFLGPWGMFIN